MKQKLFNLGISMLGVVISGVATFVILHATAPEQRQGTSDPAASTVRPASKPSQVTTRASAPAVLTESAKQRFPAPSLASEATPGKRKNNVAQQFSENNVNYPLHTYVPLQTPDDPAAVQWWTTNAQLASSWDIGAGIRQTTIAVIDSGFALQHEEFNGRWYENTGEVGTISTEAASKRNCTDRGVPVDFSCNLIDDNSDGVVDNEAGATTTQNMSQLNCTDQGLAIDKRCNMIDDDANGYADDVNGWDFINGDRSVQAGQTNPFGSGTQHGTMVSGAAAASGNNGKGGAGVDWHAKILPIQALDDDRYGDTFSVGRSIRYAAAMGADVINISLGTSYNDPYVRQAIKDALAAGSSIVASSGNEDCNCMVYPAAYPEVLAVGALSTDGSRAWFSSWGQELDIMAPGVDMTLPSWSSGSPGSTYISGAAGTSFASPIVAGLVSRMRAQQPDASPLQLTAALLENADRTHNAATASHSAVYGYGSVRAGAALQRMTTPRHQQMAYGFAPVASGNFLQPNAPLEPHISPTSIRQCSTGHGATPVYTLKKDAAQFATVSRLERIRAQQLGYTANLLFHSCLAQPHDTVDTLRTIDIFREFVGTPQKQ